MVKSKKKDKKDVKSKVKKDKKEKKKGKKRDSTSSSDSDSSGDGKPDFSQEELAETLKIAETFGLNLDLVLVCVYFAVVRNSKSFEVSFFLK